MPWLEILGDERVENRLIFPFIKTAQNSDSGETGLEALPPFRKGVREWLVFLRLTQLSLQVDGSKRGGQGVSASLGKKLQGNKGSEKSALLGLGESF